MISQAAISEAGDGTGRLAAAAAGVSPAWSSDVAADTAASVVISRYLYRNYNPNRRESNANERDSPTLIPVD